MTLTRAGGRVAVLRSAGSIVVEDREVPAPGPGEALVRVVTSGICGSDTRAFLRPVDGLSPGMILGHDAAGIVEALGDASVEPRGLVGRRVVLDPTVSCGHCVYCAQGLRQLCEAGGFLGTDLPGTLAEYLCLPAENVVPLPSAVSDIDAVLLEPIAVGLHLVDRLGPFAPVGMRAEIIGGGPMGVLLAQTLTTRGWTPTVYEPQEYRRELALSARVEARDPARAVRPTGPVLVVETSGTASGIEFARTLATAGSVIALVGSAPADFSSAEVRRDELTVMGVRGGVGLYRQAVVMVTTGQVRTGRLVTDHVELADVGDAFRRITGPGNTVMRAVVHLDRR